MVTLGKIDWKRGPIPEDRRDGRAMLIAQASWFANIDGKPWNYYAVAWAEEVWLGVEQGRGPGWDFLDGGEEWSGYADADIEWWADLNPPADAPTKGTEHD